MKSNDALLQAVINNEVDTVKSLLDQGADPNFFENPDDKITPIHLAALYDAHDVLEPLVNAGANLHAKTANNGVTALEIAKQHRYKKTTSALEILQRSSLQGSLLDDPLDMN